MPEVVDLSGRPPRTHFWSRDITVKHERFHANVHQTYRRQGATRAQAWLGGQIATDAAGATALIHQVPGRVTNTITWVYLSPERSSAPTATASPTTRL